MSPADRDAAALQAIAYSIERAYPTYSHEIRVISDRMIGRIGRPALPPVDARQVVHEVSHHNGRTVLVLRARPQRAAFGLG